jgi:hypothetical protein
LKVGEEVETPTKKDEEGSTTTDKGSLKEDL